MHTERFKQLVDEAKRQGITRDMIGASCGMSANGVTQYYGGHIKIGFEAALAFSVFFNVPTRQLCGKVDEIVVDPETDRFNRLVERVPESKRETLRQMLLSLSAKQGK